MATFSGPVTAGGDDGYWITGSTFNSTATGAFFGSGGGARNAFLRFTSVTVPQGNVISAATVDYYSAQARTLTPCNAIIYCEDSDDATAPTTTANADALTLTTASVTWDNVPANSAGVLYTTPDISGPVQEVVDRGGWASGNAMMVLIKENGSTPNRTREIATYNHATYTEPYLNITYTVPAKSPPPSTQSTKRPYQYLLSM